MAIGSIAMDPIEYHWIFTSDYMRARGTMRMIDAQ